MFCQKYLVWYFLMVGLLDCSLGYPSESSDQSDEDNNGNNEPPRRIDTHHHIIPDFYASAVLAAGGDPAGGPTPTWSVDQAKAQMAQLGIETAVVSVTAPGTKIYENNQAQGRALARQLNQFSADLAKNNSQQFEFFASLPPLIDIQGTLDEINYVYSTLRPRAKGYTLFTSYGNNSYLGHPSFQPIWTRLNELKAVVFIHPSKAPIPVVDRYLPQPLIDYPQETTRTASDLVLTGTRAMFPDVKIILSHLGGTLPFIGNRISMSGIVPQLQTPRTQLQILADFRTFYYDTAVSSNNPQLRAILEFADPKKILFGSDVPYVPFPSAINITQTLDTFFLEGDVDQGRKIWRDINRKNAKRLFQS